MAQHSAYPEELLSHKDFMRGLARTLVLDEQLAEDVTQEVWMAALKQGPGTIKHTRSWISGTLRNLIRKVKRGESRRRTRERVVALPESLPSTEEVVAREEMRRKVVDAVLALKEPLRMPLLLRYYQNLSHPEIAERLAIPLETMRTRLKTGLAQLRKKLDGDYGGRKEWCVMLAPFAGLRLMATTDHAAQPKASGSMVKLFLLGILVVSSSLILWRALPHSGEEEPSSTEISGPLEIDTAAGLNEVEEIDTVAASGDPSEAEKNGTDPGADTAGG